MFVLYVITDRGCGGWMVVYNRIFYKIRESFQIKNKKTFPNNDAFLDIIVGSPQSPKYCLFFSSNSLIIN